MEKALFGIEGIDHDGGNIYWKGNLVEIYFVDPEAEEDREETIADLIELRDRCLHMESLGLTPRLRSVISCWHWFKDVTSPDSPYLKLLGECPNIFIHEDGMQIALVLKQVAYHFDGERWHRHQRREKSKTDPWDSDCWDWTKLSGNPEPTLEQRGFLLRGFLLTVEGQPEKEIILDFTYEKLVQLLELFNVPPALFDMDEVSK